MVCHFKQGTIGGFYLYPTDELDCGQDYAYEVHYSIEQGLTIRMLDSDNNLMFDGSLDEFVSTYTEEA